MLIYEFNDNLIICERFKNVIMFWVVKKVQKFILIGQSLSKMFSVECDWFVIFFFSNKNSILIFKLFFFFSVVYLFVVLINLNQTYK